VGEREWDPSADQTSDVGESLEVEIVGNQMWCLSLLVDLDI